MNLRGCSAATLSLAIWGLAGCGGGKPNYHVSGTVTFEGKPIPKGLIFFDPEGPGPQGYASIVNGHYNTAEQGKGIAGGKYNVRVNGFDGKEGPDAPLGQGLFPEYLDVKELPKQDSTLNLAITRR
jgi:hypothetical protein